jgi:hypothetical protein
VFLFPTANTTAVEITRDELLRLLAGMSPSALKSA